MPIHFTALCMLFAVATSAIATPIELASTVQKTTVLELYTSEGCSSCPPADRWLSRLKNDDRLWREIVPIAFHVNYWDRLGWRDRFAKALFSQRQYNYKNHNYVKVIYTPGMTLNGREWRGFFDRQPLPKPSNREVGVLKAVIDGNNGTATFMPKNHTPTPLVLNVALLGFNLSSDVAAGENSGKTLHHDFVALQFQQYNSSAENNLRHWQFSNPQTAPTDGDHGIALWVTEANDPTPIQATGGWLRH